VLPPGASDVYYRDDIGNISTSTFKVTSKGVELHLLPRFPLFGGWKNNFYLGYNLPLDLYLNTLASDSSSYVLNSSFAVDMGNVFIEDLVVKIILPEGAKDARVVTPFAVDSQSSNKHFTYLDTVGRTVLVVEKKNVVREHNQYFQVHYTFSKLSMLQEPFLIIVAFLFFFLFIMFFVRFELAITKKTVDAEVDAKLASFLDSFKKQVLVPFNEEFKRLRLSDNPAASENVKQTIQKGNNQALKATKLNEFVGEKLNELVYHLRDQLDAKLELISLDKEFRQAGGKGKAKYDKEKDDLEKKLTDAEDQVQQIVDQILS